MENTRTRTFMDVSIGGETVGRIIFEMFADVCPKTCENFRCLCTGEKGNSQLSDVSLHYQGAPFHRVVKNFMVQSGDFTQGSGKGGESIYGRFFPDENFLLKHDQPFLLSMANRGKDTNSSQFFILTQEAPHLDGIHVVFGKVILGQEIVKLIENQAVDSKSRPKSDVKIEKCGELVLKLKAKKKKKKEVSSSEDSDSSSSSSEEDRKKKRKKKNKKKKLKQQKEIASDVQEEPEKDEPKFFSTIRPDEIPDIPANRFLDRYSVPKTDEAEAGDTEIKVAENPRSPVRSRRSRQRYSRDGKRIKGRGNMVYRGGSRDRSRTPPHWRSNQVKLKDYKPRKEREDKWNMGENVRPDRDHDKRSRRREEYRESDGRKRREMDWSKSEKLGCKFQKTKHGSDEEESDVGERKGKKHIKKKSKHRKHRSSSRDNRQQRSVSGENESTSRKKKKSKKPHSQSRSPSQSRHRSSSVNSVDVAMVIEKRSVRKERIEYEEDEQIVRSHARNGYEDQKWQLNERGEKRRSRSPIDDFHIETLHKSRLHGKSPRVVEKVRSKSRSRSNSVENEQEIRVVRSIKTRERKVTIEHSDTEEEVEQRQVSVMKPTKSRSRSPVRGYGSRSKEKRSRSRSPVRRELSRDSPEKKGSVSESGRSPKIHKGDRSPSRSRSPERRHVYTRRSKERRNSSSRSEKLYQSRSRSPNRKHVQRRSRSRQSSRSRSRSHGRRQRITKHARSPISASSSESN